MTRFKNLLYLFAICFNCNIVVVRASSPVNAVLSASEEGGSIQLVQVQVPIPQSKSDLLPPPVSVPALRDPSSEPSDLSAETRTTLDIVSLPIGFGIGVALASALGFGVTTTTTTTTTASTVVVVSADQIITLGDHNPIQTFNEQDNQKPEFNEEDIQEPEENDGNELQENPGEEEEVGLSNGDQNTVNEISENDDDNNNNEESEITFTDTSEYTTPDTLENFPFCGERGKTNRIVGGGIAQENEFPWLCSIRIRFDGDNSHSHACGATLISAWPRDTILVTAAHCRIPDLPLSSFKVVCGEHNRDVIDDSEVIMDVEEFKAHPDYNPDDVTDGFDIAVIKVPKTALRGKLTRKKLWPACLPSVKDSYGVGSTVIAAGWGNLKEVTIRGRPILIRSLPKMPHFVEVKTQECKDCDTCSGNTKYPKGLVCAAADGRDSCQGDSGGPLIGEYIARTRLGKRYSLMGVVSYGIGCASPGHPGAYTRFSCFLDWVASEHDLFGDSTTASESETWHNPCFGENERFSDYSDEQAVIIEGRTNKVQIKAEVEAKEPEMFHYPQVFDFAPVVPHSRVHWVQQPHLMFVPAVHVG